MSRQFDYRSTSPFTAADVYAATVDPEYLNARLAELGGRNAALLEHHADAAGARYRLRHGLDANDLPAIVRNLVPGDIVIERTESWTTAPGGFAGHADVAIPGTPASAVGDMRLRDVGTGSELVITMSVTVQVPFFGGKIESVIGDQVMQLLKAETAFTLRWLEKQHR